MRRLNVIGIGVGDPEYVTVQAINALRRTDVFFFTDKGDEKSDLLHLRNQICERYAEQDRYRIVEMEDPARDGGASLYGGAVREWHRKNASPCGRDGGTRAGGRPGRGVSRLGGSGVLRQHVEGLRGGPSPRRTFDFELT